MRSKESPWFKRSKEFKRWRNAAIDGTASEVPGMEFSGTVAAVGARVTTAQVGQNVMGIVGGGSYAEQLVTHERLLMPVPSTVSLADAECYAWLRGRTPTAILGGTLHVFDLTGDAGAIARVRATPRQ